MKRRRKKTKAKKMKSLKKNKKKGTVESAVKKIKRLRAVYMRESEKIQKAFDDVIDKLEAKESLFDF